MRVGQRVVVWYTPADVVYDQTVTSIGSRWGELDNGLRFHLKTFQVDGGRYSSPAIVFGSQREYEDSMERRRLLKILAKESQGLNPSNHRVSELRRALDVLHISHEEEKR